MGITIDQLESLVDHSVIRSGVSILDLGATKVEDVTSDKAASFLSRCGCEPNANFCQTFAESATANRWAGQLLEAVGSEYVSLDVANGYRTTLFDINRDSLPTAFHSSFDVVLNFGATAHVLNQFHAMNLVHDAVKPEGHIVHCLPCSGFSDLGYFVYTARFFFDIAVANEYSIVEMSFDGDGYDDVFSGAGENRPSGNEVAEASNFFITVIFKKTIDAPFRAPWETTTSVGSVGEKSVEKVVSGFEAAKRIARQFVSRMKGN